MLSFAIFVWAAIVVVVVVVVAVYLCMYVYVMYMLCVCVCVRIPAGHLHIMCFLAFAHVFYVPWLLRCYLWHLTP